MGLDVVIVAAAEKQAAAETIKFDPDAAEPAEEDDKETDGKDKDQEKKKDE